MHYLERGLQKRSDPAQLLPGLRSIIVFGLNYNLPEPEETGIDRYIARFARFEDYHNAITAGIRKVAVYTTGLVEGFQWKAYVDTGPLIERDYAWLAGIGRYGRNGLIISRHYGSYILLGILLCNIDLPPEEPDESGCGNCRRCIDACPAAALSPDRTGMLDARKCLSYLTLEKKGSISLTGGRYMAGCDICQEVCPCNNNRPFVSGRILKQNRVDISPAEIKEITPDQFNRLFKKTPVKRVGIERLKRNMAALGECSIQQLTPISPLKM